MADDWDSVDFGSNLRKEKVKDSWDADDPPDSWDAPSKNGAKSGSKVDAGATKGVAANSTSAMMKQNVSAASVKQKQTGSGKRGAERNDKDFERARIELAKARDVADFISSGQGEFELLQPTRKDEFDLLQHLILTKLSTCKSSKEFNPFVESLLRKLANELDTKTVKAISSSLTMIAKEKEIAEKAEKASSQENASGAAAALKAPAAPSVRGKKPVKARANINVGSVYDDYDYDDGGIDEEDEFQYAAVSKSAPSKAAAASGGGGYYDDEGEI